jgi:hypothetical protein
MVLKYEGYIYFILNSIARKLSLEFEIKSIYMH